MNKTEDRGRIGAATVKEARAGTMGGRAIRHDVIYFDRGGGYVVSSFVISRTGRYTAETIVLPTKHGEDVDGNPILESKYPLESVLSWSEAEAKENHIGLVIKYLDKPRHKNRIMNMVAPWIFDRPKRRKNRK